MNKSEIRSLISSLVHRRQKQADMKLFPLSLREANAIKSLNNQLAFREKHGIESHIILVRKHESEIRIILPGPGTRFIHFREKILDLIRYCDGTEVCNG